MLIGEPYWRREPPDLATVEGCYAAGKDDTGPIGAARSWSCWDVVEMVLVSQDGWDRYVAAQWLRSALARRQSRRRGRSCARNSPPRPHDTPGTSANTSVGRFALMDRYWLPGQDGCKDCGPPETLVKSRNACHTEMIGRQMPTSGSPMVQRRRLAAELRRLRITTGLTAEEAGKRLGWSKAKISRYELAQSGLKPVDVARLLDLYRVEGSHREQLLALAEEATHKGWWEAYSDVFNEENLAFIGLEAEATSILEWKINVVPALLQTEQYAREILTGYHEVATITPRAIERRLETRLMRQQLITRDEPLEYAAVLDESVLYRQRGDRSVMHAQLQRLTDVSELPNVTIQILPLARNHGLAVDSFAILRFGKAHETSLHDVVSIEHLSNELYVEGDTDTHTFKLAFDHLAEESLPPAESRELILATAMQSWAAK